MLKGFKNFLMRGNVIDLAVAVVVGAAFTAVVQTVVGNIIKPLLNALGTPESNGLTFSLKHGSPQIEKATLVDVSAMLNAVITFGITAAVVYFLIVMPMNHLAERRKRGQEPEPKAPAEDILLLQEIRDLLVLATDASAGPGSSSASSGALLGGSAPADDEAPGVVVAVSDSQAAALARAGGAAAVGSGVTLTRRSDH